jgi:hypothetical protein
MISLFNIRGYTDKDPLDKAPGKSAYFIFAGVNFILTIILLLLITDRVVHFNGFHLFGIYFNHHYTILLEIITTSLIFTAIILPLRKSSSLIPYLIVFLPFYLFDIYLEGHVRGISGKTALWTYVESSFVSGINPPALRFFITLSVDALIFGILGLFISRLIAAILISIRILKHF